MFRLLTPGSFVAGEVRLDPGKTENGEGRRFPLTHDPREAFEQQRAITENLQCESDDDKRSDHCERRPDEVGDGGPLALGCPCHTSERHSRHSRVNVFTTRTRNARPDRESWPAW
jgi:hypothetical protein